MVNQMEKLAIAYSTTVWAKNASSQHLDGIGVYSRELYAALKPLVENRGGSLARVAFGKDLQLGTEPVICFKEQFSTHAVKAAIFKKEINCEEINLKPILFHATDHHIPSLKKVPVVATVMDIIPFLHPEWVSGQHRWLKNWLFKKTILSAQHIITISEYSKQDLVNHFEISPANISVTPLGVNPHYFASLETNQKNEILNKYNLKPGFFLFVGTLQPRKNLERLLKAHALLPEAYQKAHPLVVVGKVGWKVEALINKLEQGEKEGKIKWLKYLPEPQVIGLLQSAQALMFISLYEGFGLPVIEAFAANCPVIASNTTSIPEAAGEAAYLVNPLDIPAIAEAMQEVIENQALVLALKEKGYQRAKLFSWDRCAKETMAVYQKLILGV